MSADRAAVVRLLARAERVLAGELAGHRCLHGHVFEARDPECTTCTYETECRFVTQSQGRERALDELLDALELAATQLEGLPRRIRHDGERCACGTCAWLREAWPLTRRRRDAPGSAAQ